MITETPTKLDVARRQIDEAIHMLFEQRDTVSTHTVACAAAQVLADIGKGQFQGWTRNESIIKPEHRKRFINGVKKFENFFKHANRDPHGTCTFHPEITALYIAESVEMLRVFTGKLTWEALIFCYWFMLAHPDVVQDSELKTLVLARFAALRIDPNDFTMMADLLKMRKAAPAAALDSLLM